MSTVGIIETEDLKHITKLTKAGDIERVLTKQGIKIFRGRHGVIWTTLDLINKAGGINISNRSDGTYDPESVIG